jgi:hypothetical protein
MPTELSNLQTATSLASSQDSKRPPHWAANQIGELCGVPVFEDSILRVYAYFPCHFDMVDTGLNKNFPLAHLNDQTETNADVLVVIVNRGNTDQGGYRFRYYHKDSTDPFDGKDLKNWYRFTGPAKHWPQAKALELLSGLTGTLPLTGPPRVLVFGDFQQTHTWDHVYAEIEKLSGGITHRQADTPASGNNVPIVKVF